MSEMSEKLKEAIDKSGFQIQDEAMNFVWKGPKTILKDGTIQQTSKKLIDCSVDELRGFLQHCDQMLNNQDNKNPGRYKVKQEIHDQIIKCNAELFLRDQINKGITKFNMLDKIRQLLVENEIKINELDGYKLNDIFVDSGNSGALEEFGDVPVSIIIDACLDKIGLFSKKHLTTTFILKQGLWLTGEEYKEHEIGLKGKAKKEKEEYFKKILAINPNHNLKISSTGLSLTQLKEALSIKDSKYSHMGTEKLKLLRNYLLFVLLKEVDNHIRQWMDIANKVDKVIEIKTSMNGKTGISQTE